MALPRRERAVYILGCAPGSGFALSDPSQRNADTAD